MGGETPAERATGISSTGRPRHSYDEQQPPRGRRRERSARA